MSIVPIEYGNRFRSIRKKLDEIEYMVNNYYENYNNRTLRKYLVGIEDEIGNVGNKIVRAEFRYKTKEVMVMYDMNGKEVTSLPVED